MFHVNPDNVATPIAASLGDLVTLVILAHAASIFRWSVSSSPNLGPVCIAGYLVLLPGLVWLAQGTASTRAVLWSGWTPILSAMAISSAGGTILNRAILAYSDIAAYQPVINGVAGSIDRMGWVYSKIALQPFLSEQLMRYLALSHRLGNLVSVQASRISTSLHQAGRGGPGDNLPKDILTSGESETHRQTARLLLALVVPGHIVFNLLINLLHKGGDIGSSADIDLVFGCLYLTSW